MDTIINKYIIKVVSQKVMEYWNQIVQICDENPTIKEKYNNI